MKRIEKPEGRFNIIVNDVERPECADTEVLIEAESSLISRGSELWRRYSREEPIDHDMMGYSLAGTVVESGEEVERLSPGDRVAALAPHAEYVTVEMIDPAAPKSAAQLPDDVSTEHATFWPLATSSVMWINEAAPEDDEMVVIQGQGLVGSGCLQVARAETDAQLVAIDALDMRCELAHRLGADTVINISETDPVETVMEMTDVGADIVIEAVGGPAGVEAFEQAQQMVARGGLIQVLGLYEEEPLPLDSSQIQGRRIVGGFTDLDDRPAASDRALELLATEIDFDEMTTHRFSALEAPEAFDFLYEHPEQALGVILNWE